MNILFIHGRAQEEYSQKELLDNWTAALNGSFISAGIAFPDGLNLSLPYYGKELIVQRELYKEDIANGIYQMIAPHLRCLQKCRYLFIIIKNNLIIFDIEKLANTRFYM